MGPINGKVQTLWTMVFNDSRHQKWHIKRYSYTSSLQTHMALCTVIQHYMQVSSTLAEKDQLKSSLASQRQSRPLADHSGEVESLREEVSQLTLQLSQVRLAVLDVHCALEMYMCKAKHMYTV